MTSFQNMYYPESPFADDFNNDLIIMGEIPDKDIIIKDLKRWLCKPPGITSIRFDPKQPEILENIQEQLYEVYFPRGITPPKIYKHEKLDVIIIEHLNTSLLNLDVLHKEVIVDPICASALLRGAHLYAPGVIGMTKDCKIGDTVSIFADVNVKNKCKKGFAKVWNSPSKVYIANGVVQMSRDELFNSDASKSGIAIKITDAVSGAPPLDTTSFPCFNAMLQNIPSIIAVQNLELNKESSVRILDMCASPGGKASHILTTMRSNARLIACDKTFKKISELRTHCQRYTHNGQVKYMIVDWSQVSESENNEMNRIKFTNILLDAPCSALGNRPQLVNTCKESVLRSFVPIQRKLITQAAKMLQVGGILVYSTCSIAMPENEGIVAFALKNHDLELVPSTCKLGGDGLQFEGIANPEYLQRFGPNCGIDSIGFFIAKFRKKAAANVS